MKMTARISDLEEVSKDIAIVIDDKGGLYDESSIEEDFYKHLFASAVSHFDHLVKLATELHYDGSGRRLKFGIVKKAGIGAFACVGKEDIDFIGVHFGTIALVSAIFTRMMSNPNILPNVGDASLETNVGQTYFIPVQEDLENFSPCRPTCSIRGYFSRFLALTGLDFIFGHEIAHITHGHLGILRKTEHFDPQKRRPKLSRLETHALELDADGGATKWTLEYANRVRNWRHKLPVEANNSLGISWREFYANERKTIRYCFFASYLTLRMTSADSWDRVAQQTVSQPLPPYRMGMLMQVYASALMQFFDLSPEQAQSQVSAWCIESEQAHANLLDESGKGELQLNAIASFITGVGNYNEEVNSAHEILAKELSEFAMGETSRMTHPRPRTCDYVVLKGLQRGVELFVIIEAKHSDENPKALELQCFFQEHEGITGLPFSLIFDSNFEGNVLDEALASDGRNYVCGVTQVTSFETVKLASILEKTELLRFSLQHSKCPKLKVDLIQVLDI
ncbi:hypothetical protein KDH83_18925 [Achromobacter sp. Marseille-Q0513]|uniref:hypothetical protein n=1 Tax=Achromobacter sp. Marseille-Q0513 TaxID=2829161 RepID=UPI001BA10095|nr:hypothetical protein [Achromobacter sp. Marseille-Q0513]MBR8655382.1 hypothetical protein [Achromobacter sp. Marseille-Q0513]